MTYTEVCFTLGTESIIQFVDFIPDPKKFCMACCEFKLTQNLNLFDVVCDIFCTEKGCFMVSSKKETADKTSRMITI